jgi:polysaccharide biosynthesis transport protein
MPVVYEAPMPAAGPEEESKSGLSIAQIVAVLRHYWKLSAVIGVTTLTLATLFVLSLPRTYSATATLMISYQNKDPLAGDQVPLAMGGAYIATQAELITSPVVLLPVIDRLKLTEDPDFAAGFKGDAAALRDLTEKNLSGDLVVDQGRGGQLLYISATASSAAKAALLANTVSDIYLEQETGRISGPASERARRYSAQLAELRTKVAAAQEKVTEFRDRNHLPDGGGIDDEVAALNAAEQQLAQAQTSRRLAEARVAQGAATSDDPQGALAVAGIKEKLGLLEQQMVQLRSTLGPEHPRIRELQLQIAAMRESLAAEMRSLSVSSTEQLRAAREVEAKYQRAVDEQRDKAWGIRKLRDEGSKLVLELESAQSVYKRALDGYDQIMFASTGDHTNTSVIARAMPPARASKSKKMKFMAAAVAVSLALAFGIPLLYELLLNRRVRCREDLERSFGVPVLAEFGVLPARAVVP